MLHGFEPLEKDSPAVRLYLDESGSLNPHTPQAVVGGLLINHSHYLHFEEAWGQMLSDHGIAAPLHMRQFGPDGRFARISISSREKLLLDAVQLIGSHKICSIAAALTNREYQSIIPPEVPEKSSVFGMCFNLAVMMNHKLAEGRFDQTIPFIIDRGMPRQHAHNPRSCSKYAKIGTRSSPFRRTCTFINGWPHSRAGHTLRVFSPITRVSARCTAKTADATIHRIATYCRWR